MIFCQIGCIVVALVTTKGVAVFLPHEKQPPINFMLVAANTSV